MVGTFAIMALIGIVIGLFSGMLGIGGGMVMVPLFRLVFGMSAVGSPATSLFTIIPTSVSGAISHGMDCSPLPSYRLSRNQTSGSKSLTVSIVSLPLRVTANSETSVAPVAATEALMAGVVNEWISPSDRIES